MNPPYTIQFHKKPPFLMINLYSDACCGVDTSVTLPPARQTRLFMPTQR